MRIGIVDADLLGRARHNFPNLACMKISAYHKTRGDVVALLKSSSDVLSYDKVYVSKVFSDTPVDAQLLNAPNVVTGGTGFYFDKAPNLPDEIEHHYPDYGLYDDFVRSEKVKPMRNRRHGLEFYTDYSIGYLTRGCFRRCPFCVNKKYERAFLSSPLAEFLDVDRPKICLLDDNFLSHPRWERLLLELQSTGKSFLFKQGLDARLLTKRKCELLFASNYVGDYTFAFDDVADYQAIEKKLALIRTHYTGEKLKFYVLSGFDRSGKYDGHFWLSDIHGTLRRIMLLGTYRALPYIMRHQDYLKAPAVIQAVYKHIRRWCNFVASFKSFSLRQEITEHPLGKAEEALKWCQEHLPTEMLDWTYTPKERLHYMWKKKFTEAIRSLERPVDQSEETKSFNVQLPASLVQALKIYCATQDRKQKDVIIDALRRYLNTEE